MKLEYSKFNPLKILNTKLRFDESHQEDIKIPFVDLEDNIKNSLTIKVMIKNLL